MWICNHYAASKARTSPCVKFYYLFPEDAHVERSLENEDPQRGRVGVFVFLYTGDKVMVCYASFSPNGDLVAFPDEDDWTKHTKFEGVELWKLLIRAGSHYHFNPETSPFCDVIPKRPNRRETPESQRNARIADLTHKHPNMHWKPNESNVWILQR